MATENESKNGDVDLYSVSHKDRERVALPREKKLDWLSEPRLMVLLCKKSFV